MLTWNELNILSYGAGTPSTSLALMSCQNALRGPPYLFPKVPVYDAVIFCDLHSEPSWVYEQAAFVAAACSVPTTPTTSITTSGSMSRTATPAPSWWIRWWRPIRPGPR